MLDIIDSAAMLISSLSALSLAAKAMASAQSMLSNTSGWSRSRVQLVYGKAPASGIHSSFQNADWPMTASRARASPDSR